METTVSSETLLHFYKTTRRHIPDDGSLCSGSSFQVSIYKFIILRINWDCIQEIEHLTKLWSNTQNYYFHSGDQRFRSQPRYGGGALFTPSRQWMEQLLKLGHDNFLSHAFQIIQCSLIIHSVDVIVYQLLTAQLNLQWPQGLNSTYCLRQRGYKFVIPLNAFIPLRCAESNGSEELKTCKVLPGQH